MSLGFTTLRTVPLTRVSTATAGTEANAASVNARFSDDGRFIIFESLATNLAPGDVNGRYDLHARDTVTGEVVRLTDNWRGEIAAGTSQSGRIALDGRLVFDSDAPNLIPAGDTNARRDVFVKDLATGESILVSRSAAGIIGNNDSLNGRLSPDGTRVLFESQATNLVGADTNGSGDLFLKTLATGAISRISAAADGAQANGQSANASFSADGTRVLFESNASNLIAGDTNAAYDIFVKDLGTGAVTRLSVAPDGTAANGHSFRASFTPDGSGVLFESLASNLVPGDTNGARDIFLKDLTTGAVTRVSEGLSGFQLNGTSQNATIAGSRVVFESSASNAVAGDGNFRRDVFMKDLESGALIRLSSGTAGEGNGDSLNVRLSPDGTRFVFESGSSNLVDGDGNGQRDIFLGGFEDAVRTGAFVEDGIAPGGRLFFDSGEDLALDYYEAEAADGALGALALVLVSDAPGPLTGELGWTWVPGAGVNALRAGQTVSETHLVRLVDIGGNEAVETVVITITGVNDAPVAANDLVTLDAGQTLDLATIVLRNDVDPDAGDSRRIVSVDATGLVGTLSLDPLTGALSYTADGALFAELPWGQSLTQQFSYTMVDGAGAASSATVDLTVLGLFTGWPATRGADVIVAGAAPAVIYGLDGDDHITGSPGNDVLDGGPGLDVLLGGPGDDVLVADHLGDWNTEFAGEGYDTTRTALSSYRLWDNVEALEYAGPARPFEGSGNALDNRITGGAANDRLYGWDGNDTLLGLAGNDTLEGGNANDTLDGGPGRDTLNGGQGADTFVLRRGESAGDIILDFLRGEGDRLLLAGWTPGSSVVQTGSSLAIVDALDGFRETLTVSGAVTPADILFG